MRKNCPNSVFQTLEWDSFQSKAAKFCRQKFLKQFFAKLKKNYKCILAKHFWWKPCDKILATLNMCGNYIMIVLSYMGEKSAYGKTLEGWVGGWTTKLLAYGIHLKMVIW